MTEDATTRRTRSEIGAWVVLGVAMNRIAADRALFQSFQKIVLNSNSVRRKTHAQR